VKRIFEIILEIIKRPELWDIPNPSTEKIYQSLMAAGVYSRKNYKKDCHFAINKYLTIIFEMRRHLQCLEETKKTPSS
jgi:hypothetical protein